jgi:hypothetical protein
LGVANQLSIMPDIRNVNWFDRTQQSILASYPEVKPWGGKLVKRLSSLLLSRLPGEMQKSVLELLPKDVMEHHFSPLEGLSDISENEAVGYPDFIEQTAATLGSHGNYKIHPKIESEYDLFEHSRKIADFFLWSIAQEFPPELKTKISENLPPELKLRMDLTSTQMEESRVA